jgi:hypothetical protein
MATRGNKLAPDHVLALNTIDLAYYGKRILGRQWQSATEAEITSGWKEYLDDLNNPWPTDEAAAAGRLSRREEIFANLLLSLGKENRFKFDRVQLKKGAYFPSGHQNAAQEQDWIRKLAIEFLMGKRPVKVDVNSTERNPDVEN